MGRHNTPVPLVWEIKEEQDAQMAACPATAFPRTVAKLPMQDRYSGFRIDLLTAPSLPDGKVALAVFVPGYSSATATDFHRLPCVCVGPRARGPLMVGSIRGILANVNQARAERWIKETFRTFGWAIPKDSPWMSGNPGPFP